jgi:DNA-binding SARP family transcriptional activator/tetratricopeptide (TPR) repeat protein
MEFRILGPLYADAGGGRGSALIRQPLLQSALAVLLLRANRPCPRGMLIDALWAGEPPSSPDAALRVCISRLRRCLGDCAVRLESIGPPGGRAPGHRQQRGYMMTVRPGELDVDEFTDLVAQGQAELDAGNAAAAATSLVHALALWGDPPLPDLPESEIIAADLERLTNLRETAVDTLIEARLASGDVEQVLGQLRAIVAATPGRERVYDQLMRAYHALGMRKEALDVYQVARRAMREQQGTEPGQALAVLHKRILAEEMAAESTAHLSAISLSTPMLLGWQAPAPPSDFVGRSAEIAAIIDRLSGPSVPVTVVTGGPGVGKTATVATAALQLRQRFSDGQLYAELGGLGHARDPQEIISDMLRAMGIPARSIPAPGPARAAMYRSLIAGRKVLVIADDAATAAQVRLLVPAASGAAVLVTSRGRLSGLAGAATVELGGLPEAEALALLGRGAGADRVAAEPGAAREIIDACGGLPLAVRLAATTLALRPGMALRRLAEGLSGSQALDVLAAEDTSVRAAIGTSYRALPAAARAAISMASATMPGDIPGWALAELAHGDPAVADHLTAVGLLTPVESEASGRGYRMARLTRAFLREREPADRDPAALVRLRAGWLRRSGQAVAAAAAMPFLPTTPPAMLPAPDGPEPEAGTRLDCDWLDREQANLLAAADQASTAGAHAEAVELAVRVTARQCATGGYSEAITLWRAVAGRAEAAQAQTAARAQYFLAAVIAGSHDRTNSAVALLADCVPRLELAEELDSAAYGHCLLGRYASMDRRHASAIRSARRAAQLAGDGRQGTLVRCCALSLLGITLARMGIVDGGARYCQQARADAQVLAEPVYEAHAARALAQVLILRGDYRRAIDVCQTGISLARGYGGTVDMARLELVAGRAHQCNLEYAEAAVRLRAAADVFRDAGLILDEVTATSVLAACLRSAGQGRAADDCVARVSRVLARSDVADAESAASAAEQACHRSRDDEAPSRGADVRAT